MRPKDSKKSIATRGSSSEQIYLSLKASIVNFLLKPGQKLTEAELGKRFKVSRTPVREVLQRMAREGLVRPVPREGYFVRAFDLTEIDKYYEVRVALEALSVRLATSAIRPDVMAELRAYWCRPPAKIPVVDADVFVERDEDFHETIAEQSGNPILLRFLREINPRIRIIRRLDYTEPTLIRKSFKDHAAVLKAMLAKHAEEAVLRMKTHIGQSRERTRGLAAERLARIYH